MSNSGTVNSNSKTSIPTGKALFPLRIFLGVMFVYAALTKLTDATFFDPASPNGVAGQMRASASSSPIGSILNRLLEHSTTLAYAIAIGELFIGLGILFGIWTRFAGIGLALVSFSFVLTVSWGTTPYFLNTDLAYLAAALPFIIAGDGGYKSVEANIRQRIRNDMVASSAQSQSINSPLEARIERRTLIRTGAVAGSLGLAGLATGLIGQKIKGPVSPIAQTLPTTSPTGVASSVAPTGTKIAIISDVAVGTAFQFVDPATGSPAYLMQPASGTFIAYSAVCTHEGCIVNDNVASGSFNCPCHGAQFDAVTGAKLRGPGNGGLAKLNVAVSGTDIFLA